MSDSVKKYYEDLKQTEHTKYPGDIKVTIDEPVQRDKYIQAVKDKFEQRSQTGIKKYGTTLERDDLNSLDWLTHLEEELMDALGYIQVLRDKLQN
jgi:hypothetical protein